jgi:hypothetical protein
MQPRIHLADPSPPHCSACFQAKPAERHVDFSASTDGPVIPEQFTGAVGVVGHVIDEIIICETCLAEAARLVGLEDAAKLRGQLDQALAANDRLHEQLAGTRTGVTDALELVRKAARGEPTPASPNGALPTGRPGAAKPRPARTRTAA